MNAQLLPDGGLMVPARAEGPDGIVGDGMVAAPPGSDLWERWAPLTDVRHAACGQRVTPIVWGLPTEADRSRTPAQGRIILGGDCFPEVLQHWACEPCGWRYLDADQLVQP